MQALDLDLATEFLLIAATLVELKARRLLPGPAPTSTSTTSSRCGRSATCCSPGCSSARRSRTSPAVFGALADEAGRSVPAARSAPTSASPALAPDLLAGRDAAAPARRRHPGPDARGRCRGSTCSTSPRSGSAWPTRSPSWSTSCPRVGRITFARLTADLVERLDVIVRFLAVLELFKQGLVEVDQTERFGDITHRVDRRRPGRKRWRRSPSTPTTDDLTETGDEPRRRIREYLRAIEAVVLVAHDPVPPELLAQLLEQPVADIERWCDELAARVRGARTAGSSSCAVAGGYRFQTHPDLTPYVERFLLHDQRARLSGAALETLAIVAYKQPISRAQIASIRGVDPDGVLRTLQGRGYIDAVGHDPGPGQAVLYGTTTDVPREARPRLARRPARRSPSSSPVPTWSRPSRPACGSPMPRDRPDDDRPSRRSGSSWTTPPRRAGRPTRRGGERLQKVLATSGLGQPAGLRGPDRAPVGSRSTARSPMLGRRVDPENDLVEVDGAPVGAKPGLVHYLLNKPAGVVTTAKDTHGRPTVRRAGAGRAAGVPGRPARRRDRGPAAADERRRAGQPHRPPPPRRRQGVPGDGRPAARCAAGAIRRLRDGVELDDGLTAPAKVSQPTPACCGSRSTRAATARSGGCARPSATPSPGSCAPGSARSHDRRLKPGDVARAHARRGPRARRGRRPTRQAPCRRPGTTEHDSVTAVSDVEPVASAVVDDAPVRTSSASG